MNEALDVRAAAAALRAGTVTSVELTAAVIAAADHLDPLLGTYVTRMDDAAMQAATLADAAFAAGIDRGPLQGIPMGVKDIVAVAGAPTTANSTAIAPRWGSGTTAPAVQRLIEVGAVITGKVTTNEFAFGAPGPDSPFAVPKNPWNLRHTPGGSSSGTANGVAAGLFHAGLGSDTAGSLRIPAAFCGITALVPTFGTVPVSGVVPAAWSLDRVGPMARTAWDCAAVLDVIGGRGQVDAPLLGALVADAPATLEGLRVGVVRDGHDPVGTDPACWPAVEAAVDHLALLGADVVELGLPLHAEVAAAGWLTIFAEAFAYHRSNLARRWADYGPETRHMVALGAFVTGPEYVQAQRVRQVGRQAVAELLADVDVLIVPTVTVGAPLRVGDEGVAGFSSYVGHVHTAYWAALGLPVLAMPVGFTAEGLPLGCQVIGRAFDEATVVRVGHAHQSVTDWHRRTPPVAERAGLDGVR